MVLNSHDSVNQFDAILIRRYRVYGIVQGVGFRPFVHRLAQLFDATGWVLNDSEGVLIEIQATQGNLTRFLDELILSPPPMAKIISIQEVQREKSEQRYKEFSIRQSHFLSNMNTIIPPDSNVCSDCLEEMNTSNNRRYKYAFINCTNCGPRYSIIKGMPYDREKTTMRAFSMCSACKHEYDDIEDRRYHAQPNACPECGPQLQLTQRDGSIIVTNDIIDYTLTRLQEGAIVAVKSLGGFHLVTDASNEKAVQELRKRKRRDSKPFAVMLLNSDTASRIAYINVQEQEVLESSQRPIVLLRKRDNMLANSVAPHNPNIGVMLPSTPLQYLLLSDPKIPALVMTSGNRSGHPIVCDNASAIEQLGDIADYFILNNRDIYTRVDDSVVRVMSLPEGRHSHLSFIRRSRGYAPYPVHLPFDVGKTIALGAELKTTVSIAKGKEVFISQHIGDLKNDQTFNSHNECVNHLQKLLGTSADAIACDLHPSFRSTRNALKQSKLQVIQVQHHHAHMVSCMAENGLSGKTIGVIFDGTGYGTDGTIWGGEFLTGDEKSFVRAAHLSTFALPGGDRAVKEPIRVAISLLTAIYGEHLEGVNLPALDALSVQQISVYAKMAARHFNSPQTSSMGRLFDGISALIGICSYVEYEAQAAIELEALLNRDLHMSPPFSYYIHERNGHLEVDYRPMIKELVSELATTVPNLTLLSRRFHSTIVDMIISVCKHLSQVAATRQVVLSGGVFLNEFILLNAVDGLNAAGLKPYFHQCVPTNDGGISLGQIVVAMGKLQTKDSNVRESEHV
ncbi:TPA: carbamoyltransferase HypF [Enterobacter cloacae]|uniref:carbamoyltransferase HypF n=1 Tax=Enterobacter cloacae complex TaxID=354276 RepID=UPI00077B905B|nr:carbamoyltransferase HypF [Enterobacter cloacae]MCK6805402.1 carbamoyltransferase HypF [Enterobacter cloacae]MCK6826499.1 carbamoyltransferase HypF [Enterobacter cloacae]MDT0533421.1 carbamoyltransferase HypF [Enterobacter cloacae]